MSTSDYFLDYVRRNRRLLGPDNPDNYVGVYSDQNRRFTTDISENVADPAEAQEQAARSGQSAVFDNATGQPVDVPTRDHGVTDS